jgi:salicylate hydroxylase
VDRARPILIAGGGIAGLACALALARVGRSALVLEREPAFAEAGAGIQLGPNGVRVLQHLGVADRLAPLAGRPEWVHVRDGASARSLARLPLGSWIAARHEAPYWVVHRHDLHGALSAAAAADPRIAVRHGFDVVAADQSPVGVRAFSASGEEMQGAALVGADGLWSKVRDIVLVPPAPQFSGKTAARGLISAQDAGALETDVVGLWLSPRAHVVHYPVRAGSEMAVIVIAAEPWRGREWGAPVESETVLSRLTGFYAGLTRVLGGVRQWRKWALYRLPALSTWSRGRITLAGDAAHPMLPYLAQGGVLALEDAVVLAQRVAAFPGEEFRAFAAYEATRRERARRAQAASRRNGLIYHLPPPLSWTRNTALRLPGTWLMARYDWLYGWRPNCAGLGPLRPSHEPAGQQRP